MVDRYFLALDHANSSDAFRAATAATGLLRQTFPSAFNERNLGVKLNQNLLTGNVDARLMAMPNTFADIKVSHGPDTGKLLMEALSFTLPDLSYVTVSASLGLDILRQYVEFCQKLGKGVKVIAFTAHTKMTPEDVKRVYGVDSVEEAVYRLGQIAVDAGCDAIVLEAAMLKVPRIAALRIKKLVTGIRIDPEDKGAQQRVTSISELAEMLPRVDYVVVSKRYLEDPEALRNYFSKLLIHQ
jgi:orotidine-5'-phosphate decarboxylase